LIPPEQPDELAFGEVLFLDLLQKAKGGALKEHLGSPLENQLL